jgi:hypothetical protein
LLPCLATSICCLIASSRCFKLLPCHLTMPYVSLSPHPTTSTLCLVALLCCVALNYFVASLCCVLLRIASLPRAIELPLLIIASRCLIISLPLPFTNSCYLDASSCLTLLRYLPTLHYFHAWLPSHLKYLLTLECKCGQIDKKNSPLKMQFLNDIFLYINTWKYIKNLCK